MAEVAENLLNNLYDMIQNARSFPLGADKCIIDRDKALDMLDQIGSQLPSEMKQAKTILDSRSELVTAAKRDAESIRRQAEERAKQLISREEIVKQATIEAKRIIQEAEVKARELKKVTNDYVDDNLKRTEEAVSAALSEIKQTRQRFRVAAGQVAAAAPAPQPVKEEAPAEEEAE